MHKLDHTLDFLRALWATMHALETRSAKMNQTLGLTGPQRFVIRLIQKFPGITARELCAILHLNPSTLSVQLKRLQEGKLIERKEDAGDRRRIILHATARGEKLLASQKGTIEVVVSRFLARQSPATVQKTKAALQALAEALDE